jgi:aminoglycoside phosphotransferase (APT) family kinase protein
VTASGPASGADLERALGDFLARRLGRDAVEVRDLLRLSGGASRETWELTLLDALDGRTEALILQRVRGGMTESFTMEGEAQLLRAAAVAGVPVAEVVAVSDDASVLGAPFLVMRRVDGETIARRILRDPELAAARSALVGQCADALAAIHRLPTDAGPHLRSGDPVAQLRGLLDGLGQPHPAFELGLRWLDARRPDDVPARVVHGDFRLGNLIVGHDGLRAVVDWELAHLGDPVEDLGWLCVRAWRFGSPFPVAGVGERDALYAAYAEASGEAVDPERARWWEVLGTLRWGIICILQASAHLSGASRSVELAAIGRRVCENEYDLLDLIGARPDGVSRAGPAASDDARPALHDAPTAAQLVEAVRELLDGDVLEATEGRLQFHVRVAARVLAIVERELADDAAGGRPAHAGRLAALGVSDDAELARCLRDGSLDADRSDVRATVWVDVLAKLRVANPSYLLPADA